MAVRKSRPVERRAFTLIELLLVITIISVLAAVIVPRFFGRSREARVVAARQMIVGTFGVAIDRELTGALSLRVATPIVGAWYARTETKLTGQPTQDGEELGAGLMLAPSLELRLAF
jgi:prepilin-type N-terminal cleavage/methylation domain-containing protein